MGNCGSRGRLKQLQCQVEDSVIGIAGYITGVTYASVIDSSGKAIYEHEFSTNTAISKDTSAYLKNSLNLINALPAFVNSIHGHEPKYLQVKGIETMLSIYRLSDNKRLVIVNPRVTMGRNVELSQKDKLILEVVPVLTELVIEMEA